MFTTPQEAEQAFYQALRQADLALMMQVWADDEEVVCIHPGGMRTIGHDALKSAWQQIFANGPVNIQPVRPMIMTSVMSSIHVLIEQLSVSTAQGSQTAHCYSTNIFHKGRYGWKMVLHHASHAPQEIDLFDLQDRPDTLH
ncbi:nuclear transport factor 2 family protein [Pusillimonas sp. MFBS29]|uniref:YybH family protein n=1 Tax=Pusillimonas sp. MFBS29 TaxID=2886690 RepID=UPI001D0FB380|nr:nuclear transport factor 2 family protein [Pusillimonas sp. MFBS29]MCC2594954.1 nuclear transport factor 2 family protein [Pusillimonas sp. MFBS29]